MNTYTDPFAYLRAATGHDTSTVIANLTRIASNASIGATSISLQAATTTALNQYDQVYIFDGSASEIVTMTPSTTGSPATSLTVSATQYAHSAGTPICSDGTGGIAGSLASMIFTASSQIEEYCRQPLLQATYSNEQLPLRTMRAAVTRDYTLMIRPKRFPVTAVSAASLILRGQTTITLDTSQVDIDADAQLVNFLQIQSSSGGNGGNTLYATWPIALPATPGYAKLSYTAGYVYSTLPPDVRQACIWLVSDLLSDRRNPTGAAELRLGDMQLVTRLRGDTTGRSVLTIRAYDYLEPYRQKAM
jgi:hypothetical protein